MWAVQGMWRMLYRYSQSQILIKLDTHSPKFWLNLRTDYNFCFFSSLCRASLYENTSKSLEDLSMNPERSKPPPLAPVASNTAMSGSSPDLISLQTPNHQSMNPQSSITGFTLLAQSRAKKVPVKQDNTDEDQSLSQGAPAQGNRKPNFLSKSQSAEFLDRIGNTTSLPKVVPRRNKYQTSLSEDKTDLDSPTKPIPKPRTLPRPKLSQKREKIQSPSSDSPGDIASIDVCLAAKKRQSTFEKSGEVFSLTESL